MARLDKLWTAVGGPGKPPAVDKRAVKARVNAALDADRKERRIYMRQKTRIAIVVAVIAAAITGSALAVTNNWDMVQLFFKGDTASAQEYLDTKARSVRDKNYTLTVEGSMSDERNVYLIATVTANSEEAKKFLYDDSFVGMDTFSLQSPSEQSFVSGFSSRELNPATENTRSFRLIADLTGPAESIRVRLGYMEENMAVEIPLVSAPSITVELGVSGVGIPDLETPVPSTFTVEQVTLSPFTCQVECTDTSFARGFATKPRIFFRMADGSVRTQSQMMNFTSARNGSEGVLYDSSYFNYEFFEVQDLENIVSIIVFDVEYPLDGSEPVQLEHDPALDPFTIPRMEKLKENGGFSIPVRLLTEKLGGTCDWDPVTGDVTCAYRGVTVVLRPGYDTATVNGQPVTMSAIPAVQNGSLAASYQLFADAWGLDGFVSRSTEYIGDDVEITWGDWYIIP